MPGASDLFNEEQRQAIVKAIAVAERATSGEIRVHIEDHSKGDALTRAKYHFHGLKMDRTALANGVLIYLAVKDHTFAIIGDKGINEKVPADFWDTIKNKMEAAFREGRFTEGLCEGIAMAGEKLKEHFPAASGDKDELSNEVSFNR